MRSLPALFSLLSLLTPVCAATATATGDARRQVAETWILRYEDRRVPFASSEGRFLAGYLADEDPAVRVRAALALGRIGDPASVPALAEALGDRDAAVREAAAFALGEIGTEGSVAPLVSALRSGEGLFVRAAAAEALGKTADPRGAAAIREVLRDAVPFRAAAEAPLVEAAAAAAWKFKDPSLAGELLPLASPAAVPPSVRRAAVYSLAAIETQYGRDALRAAALDLDPELRAFAARGLRFRMDREAFELLLGLAGDSDRNVRILALRSLARPEAPLPPGPFAVALEDPDPAIRRTALETVGSRAISHPGILELVAAAAEDLRSCVRATALPALASCAGEEALPILRRTAADDTDWTVRAAAARALGKIPGPAAAEALRRLLHDREPRVVPAALEALDESRPEGWRDDLRSALSSPDFVVRGTAASLLAGTGDATHFDAIAASLEAAAKDEQNDARLATIEGLAKLDAERARPILEKTLRNDPDWLVRRKAADLLDPSGGPGRRTEAGVPDPERDWGFYRDVLDAVSKSLHATVETSRGSFDVELHGPEAPLTVWSFVELSRKGFFDGLPFHRVVPAFVVQGGDPRGDGNGGPGRQVRCEINRLPFRRGAVGMALSGKDTGGSQWFVTLSPQPHLDGGYTVFGQVVSGMDVVDALEPGDLIRSVRIRE